MDLRSFNIHSFKYTAYEAGKLNFEDITQLVVRKREQIHIEEVEIEKYIKGGLSTIKHGIVCLLLEFHPSTASTQSRHTNRRMTAFRSVRLPPHYYHSYPVQPCPSHQVLRHPQATQCPDSEGLLSPSPQRQLHSSLRPQADYS